MAVSARSLKPSAGFVTIPVACDRAAREACQGTLTLTRRVGRRWIRLGSGEFYTDPGDRDPVLVALTKAGKKLVAPAKRAKRIRVTLRITARDGGGKRFGKTRTVLLVTPARRR